MSREEQLHELAKLIGKDRLPGENEVEAAIRKLKGEEARARPAIETEPTDIGAVFSTKQRLISDVKEEFEKEYNRVCKHYRKLPWGKKKLVGRARTNGTVTVVVIGVKASSTVTSGAFGVSAIGHGVAKRNPHDPIRAESGEKAAMKRAINDLIHQLRAKA